MEIYQRTIADWRMFCIHLRSLKVRHFGVGLNDMESSSPSVA
jgi:hypothetical protein